MDVNIWWEIGHGLLLAKVMEMISTVLMELVSYIHLIFQYGISSKSFSV